MTFDWSHSTTQGDENAAVGDHCIASRRPSGWFAHVFVNRPVLSKASKQRREIIEFVTKTTWSEAWRLQSSCRTCTMAIVYCCCKWKNVSAICRFVVDRLRKCDNATCASPSTRHCSDFRRVDGFKSNNST